MPSPGFNVPIFRLLRGQGDRAMDRREFIGMLARALFAAPLAVNAQPAGKIYRIGYLSPGNPEGSGLAAFKEGLSRLGWEEAHNVVIEKRWGASNQEGLSALAADLLASKVDVIVTISTPAALAARQTTSTLPIVMAGSSDPVGNGLVAWGVIGLPILNALFGQGIAQADFFGTGADSTVAATLGVLLLARGRRWPLWPIPLAWCAITGAFAAMMRLPAAPVMPLVALVAVLAAVFESRRRHRVA